MAGVITHLIIANEIIKLIPEELIRNKGSFLMGSVAPDAVHARENYIRAYKKHSHFRDDIPDMAFEEPANYELYQKRLVDFIRRNNNRDNELLDLYRGYVVHIIADELFILSVRKEFCAVMDKLGIEQSSSLFFEYIVNDMTRNDMLLLERYGDMADIRTAFEAAATYPIEDYVSEPELKVSKEWLIRHHFIDTHDIVMPTYISYERINDFIYASAQEIVKRLTYDNVLPGML